MVGSDTLVEQMFQVGAHYGYSKTRRHPSVAPYIYATKNKLDIIDLEKTAILLKSAENFAEKLASEGKVILLVGTKPEAKNAVKSAAETLQMPYVTERWIGGTISNFSEIKKRIAELREYREDSERGELEKYTKKERMVLGKKMERLSRYYSGLIDLKKIPDALFIVDAKAEHIATTEATKCSIPVIAVVNSDSDIKRIDYPIVANDAAIPSINFFAEAIVRAFKRGEKNQPTKAPEQS